MVQEPKYANPSINQLAQMEAGLRENEPYFRAIFNQTLQLIGLLNPKGIVIELNQTALDFGKLDRAEVIGRPFWEMGWWTILPSTVMQVRQAIASAAQGETVRGQVEILTIEDTIATIEFVIKPIRDQAGQIDFLLWEGQDISVQKRAEAQICELQAELEQAKANGTAKLAEVNQQQQACLQREQTQLEFYSNIINNMQFGLLVWQLEDSEDITSLRLIAANPAASQLVGMSLENSLGRRITECFANILKNHKAYLELYAQVAISGQGQEQYEDYYSDEGINGKYFSIKVFPLPNQCVGVAFDDITESKLAEQALRESEERFHTMADIAPSMIWMSGIDKLCNYFNKGWLNFTGRTMEQELGKGWTEGVHPDDLEYCIQTYTTAFDAREPFKMEYRLRRFDGEYRWILDAGTTRWNPDGSLAGYIGSCIDITEQKQIQEILQQRATELTRINTILAQTTTLLKKRNDELDQFAYVTSHDLKAPLRAIANLSEWIEEDLDGQLPEENQHQMRLLRGRVQRMEALINGLLDYSRIGRMQTPVSVVDVNDLLQEVIDSLAPPATFTIEVEPPMPILTTKRLPLQQVFTNLIGNAIQHHTRIDGHVKISVQDQGDYYEFTVADDGPGIAPEYQDKVFVIFQTLEPRDRKENTGVGLAIVKKIVETEIGMITLESQISRGCTFRFTWPKQPKE